MVDVTSHIRIANPELAHLIARAKVIYELCGGLVDERGGKVDDSFEGRRATIARKLQNMDQLVETRDQPGLSRKDQIMLNNKIRKLEVEVGKDIEALNTKNREEVGSKKSKLTPEDMAERTAAMQQLLRQLTEVRDRAAGRKADEGSAALAAAAAAAAPRISEAQLRSDGFTIGGAGGAREEITAEQQMMLDGVQAETQHQDEILAQIETVLAGIKESALQMGDELDHQSKVLDDLSDKVDQTQNKMDRVNTRLDRALDLANEKSTSFCMYVICLAILLGLVTVIFKMSGSFF